MTLAKPDPGRPVVMFTDFDRLSYAVIGRLFHLSIEAAGFSVEERRTPATALERRRAAGQLSGQWVIHNTIGSDFIPVASAYNIALPAHEWSAYPRAWVENLNRFDEIWCTTSHVITLLRDSGVTAPVYWLPPALDADPVPARDTWAGMNPFRFFSCGEAHFRKGFHLLMEGFMTAFAEPGEAELTIKTTPGCAWTPPREDITIDTALVPREQLLAQYADYDAYVTASLAEGLGLPVAEAVLARTPVAANFWGGHASLLADGGFWPIGHEPAIQPFCSDPSFYAPGQKCAYSSPERIAEALQEVRHAGAAERERRAELARDYLISRFGAGAAQQRFFRRLCEGEVDE